MTGTEKRPKNECDRHRWLLCCPRHQQQPNLLPHTLPSLSATAQVRFECADALLNSHVSIKAACGALYVRHEQNPAEQAAAVALQRHCLHLLHRACVAVPQLGPVTIACQAPEVRPLWVCY